MTGDDRSKFEDDRPTQPDTLLVRCPACRNVEGEATGLKHDRGVLTLNSEGAPEQCPYCQGLRKVDREGLAKWRLTVGAGSSP